MGIQNLMRTAMSALWLTLSVFAIAPGSTAQGSPRIQNLVEAGNLDGMQWPNFSDYRPWVQKLYEPVGFAAVWVRGTTPSPQARAMIDLFAHAWQKGLEPDDYDASRWEKRLESLQSPAGGDPDAFDVALSVCAMRYVSDLRIGRISPKHLQFDLTVEAKKYDLAQFVRDKLMTASDPAAVMEEVEPHFDIYRRTEEALARYIELARSDNGEKLPVPANAVEPGKAYAGVPRLVEFLKLVGDLPADFQAPNSDTYDPGIAEGVKKFQRRHGLDDDGRLGPSTVKQLNVPLADRVRQLKLTLERWRWLPAEFSVPPIVVNIPDFRLRALDENNKIALEMPVVVGKAMLTQTPVFTQEMTFVVFRPYWNVPPGILGRTVLPAINRDRDYLSQKNFEVTTHDGKVVTSGDVSDDVLAQLQARKLTVRQKPGPDNSLGLVKLMFPNEYNVYLHDTPQHDLFEKSKRDFSSGCVRVGKPAELAAWVLRNNPGWTLERVQQAMQNGPDNVAVTLARRVPVFILYGTAIGYENNEVHFYDDIYGHDAKLAEALAKGYPYP
jgi:L,D-transpeptidase YcbB